MYSFLFRLLGLFWYFTCIGIFWHMCRSAARKQQTQRKLWKKKPWEPPKWSGTTNKPKETYTYEKRPFISKKETFHRWKRKRWDPPRRSGTTNRSKAIYTYEKRTFISQKETLHIWKETFHIRKEAIRIRTETYHAVFEKRPIMQYLKRDLLRRICEEASAMGWLRVVGSLKW